MNSSTHCSGTFSHTLCFNCFAFSLLVLEAFLWNSLLLHLLSKYLFDTFLWEPFSPRWCHSLLAALLLFLTILHDRSSSPPLNMSLLDVTHCFSHSVHSLDVFMYFSSFIARPVKVIPKPLSLLRPLPWFSDSYIQYKSPMPDVVLIFSKLDSSISLQISFSCLHQKHFYPGVKLGNHTPIYELYFYFIF